MKQNQQIPDAQNICYHTSDFIKDISILEERKTEDILEYKSEVKVPRASPRLSLSFLGTIKDQKALNLDSAKATLPQKFPASVNREFSHNHNGNILIADASFT